MRTYVISTLFLVFAMVSGACAGRQVRTRTIAAPPLAEASTPVAEEAVPAPTPADVDPAPIAEQADPPAVVPDVTFPQQIEVYAASEIAGHGAAPRPAQRLRHKTAPAVEDGGRAVVVGSLVAAPPAIEQAPAASAAPSILPAPQGVKADLNAGPAKDRDVGAVNAPAPKPGPEALEQSRSMRSAYLTGTALAALVGTFFALMLVWLQRRRLRAIASAPYDNFADGTILTQKVVRGQVILISATPPAEQPRSEPEAAERQAQMDTIEKTWHAEGEAIDTRAVLAAARPLHDEFDTTDIDAELEQTDPQPPPVPFSEPDIIVAPEPSSSHVQPETEVALTASGADPATEPPREPRSEPESAPAAGSVKIVSSDVASTVSGGTPIPEPPMEPRSEPVALAKVIILFEDKSSDDQAATSATAITH
ncbi:MAG TPA: hypothetical protein VL283_00355 [Candidatus Baltobacteraceae bacterium]|nr:hypothetical protein [Candidatus Baltobacteraceae bacterium]